MVLSRRGLFVRGAAFIAAPSIVRVDSLMKTSTPRAIDYTTQLAESFLETKWAHAARVLDQQSLLNGLIVTRTRFDVDRFVEIFMAPEEVLTASA